MTKTWQGEGIWEQDGETRTVNININPYGLSVLKQGQELFFTKDEFFVREASESGYVKIEIERASLNAVLTIESVEAFQTLKADKFDKNRKPLLSVSSLIAGGIVVIIIALVLLFTLGADVLSGTIAKVIPVETEAEFGKAFFQQSLSQAKLNSDSATNAVLKKCAQVVETFSVGRPYKFHIVLVEDSIKNAFALPGGYIVIYRGILDLMESDDELFGLLGHESGHVYLQHGFKRMIRSSMIALTFAMLFGDTGGLTAILLENSKTLLNLAYDRNEETAADTFGFQALQNANAPTNGMITLFEKLDQSHSNAKLPAFLSTHPDIKERIKELKKKSPRKSGKRFLEETEWKILKRKA